MQSGGARLRRILGAFQGVSLDPVGFERLKDVARALEYRGHGSLVRLQQVLALGVAQLWLEQAQLGGAIRSGAGGSAEVGDLRRQRIDRLALLAAD